MRINAHSTLTANDVRSAVTRARTEFDQDIYLDDISVGPKGAIEFYCASEHGKFACNRRNSDTRAATWVAWGYVIADLYRRDPDARIGFYRGVNHFRTWCYECQEQFYNLRKSLSIRNRNGGNGSDVSFLDLTDGYNRETDTYDAA